MPTATTKPSIQEIMENNALVDASEIALCLRDPFRDGDIGTFQANQGIRLDLAVKALCRKDEAVANNRYVKQLAAHLAKGGTLSTKQQRAALNILREHVQNLKPSRRYEEEPEFDPDLGGRFSCYVCASTGFEEHFEHLHDLYKHRKDVHGYAPLKGSKGAAILSPLPVLRGYKETEVDISHLRDGFYAFPHESAPSSTNGWVFLKVRRTLKNKELRNRNFQFGKRITGQELVPAGTIEVRHLSSDMKELVGEQRPGDKYRGRFADILTAIGESDQTQASYALAYTIVAGVCAICGKALTDDISRNDRMGKDCYEQWGDEYWSLNADAIYARRLARAKALAEARMSGEGIDDGEEA